jgi:dihydroflavonol-4-reductase
MEPTLVTGATGLVGNAIVRELLARGRDVRALVRSRERASTVIPAGCDLVEGDVTDPRSLHAATRGCEVVYHAAGLPEQWLADAATFERVNVGGTRNALEAARAAGVRRFIYTSTIDVFMIRPGQEFDESTLDRHPKHTTYERSKQKADRLVVQALGAGVPAVFLHPSGVYGPGPASSPGLNRAIAQVVRREIPLLLPGSVPVVYVDDVGRGHVLAEEKAEVGERFILHESAHTLTEFAREVCAVAGEGKVPPVLPLWCARLFAAAGETVSGLTRKPPIVARGQVEFLQCDARPSSRHAQERLGWKPTAFREGVARTLAWLRDGGQLPSRAARESASVPAGEAG